MKAAAQLQGGRVGGGGDLPRLFLKIEKSFLIWGKERA